MEAFFLELVKLSLIGSLFAAAVMLVRLVFPKTPKWILCLMWGVVALRLIFPVSIESKLSLVPENIASGQIITSVGDTYIGDVEIIRENDTGYRDAVDAGRQPVSTDDGYYVVTEKDSLEAPKTVAGTLYPILSWVWAAGVAAMLIYTAVSYLMLRRKMAEATLLRENIWQCEQVDSPFVLGFIRPKIYLPYTITDSDMVNVIAHEQAHIHRRDHWWKPIGFILLSVYWFNPVLWVAYIMLCRDIEAACDEKVIKHMERDEMRAYSTALLNCSVNRRRIAACPLAFGEVGVKERVKTVMNYKKPAFWIVIAAVALCIVVAVSFLTDPKDYGPEVGNPKMLEFPGVEWGMTVEEVKQALDLTEEQILLDDIHEFGEDNGDIFDLWYLYASDLTAYEEDVVSAAFEFIRYPGNDFGLIRVRAYFAEDTDMVKLEEELTELYGQGVGSTYRFYALYGPDRKQYLNVNANGDLKLLAQRSDEDGIYSNALNDPEYREQLWVATGADLLSDDVENWYIESLVKNGYTEEAIREWLGQEPLVRMFIANRTYQAADREANGIEDEYTPYITHNFMEYNANDLVCYSQLRAYETYRSAMEEVIDPSLLELPGIKWGASVDEVKDALNLTDEQITADEMVGESDRRLVVSGLEYFGSQVERAEFMFAGYGGGIQELYTVRLRYADGTDMAQIRDNMKVIYGTGYEFGFTDYAIHDGEAQSFINYNYSNKVEYGTAMSDDIVYKLRDNPMIHTWASTAKGTEINSQEVVDTFVALYTDPAYFNHASREEVLEWIDKHPWVTVTCSNGSTVSKEPLCSVYFAAEFIAVKRQAMAWMDNNPTEDTTPTGPATLADIMASVPALDDGSMLCFPGTRWGSTPEEVKAVLNVADEQIITDQPIGDSYILLVTGVPFFGSEVVSAEFKFIARNDEFGLATVNLYYPDGTDMSTVEAALLDLYGAPNEGRGFTCYKVSNGTVEPYSGWGFTSSFSGKGPFVMNWWESTAKRADLLPAAVQEAMIESGYLTYYMERLDPADPSTRNLILEYLNKDPAVLLYCTNGSNAGNVGFQYYTKNEVSFSALDYMIQLLYNSK